MNGLDFLNLVIGLLFIYLIYSIAASTVWEMIISLSNLRGRRLQQWIMDNFNLTSPNGEKRDLGNKILEHPAIKGLLAKSGKKPTYISSDIFTDVIIDLIVNEGAEEENAKPTDFKLDDIKDKIVASNLLDNQMKRMFLQYFTEVGGDFSKWKEKIGNWYDQAMERLIGSYKKSLQLWIFVIAFFLVFLTNADTFKLANYLYKNPQAAESLAQKADLYLQDTTVINSISVIDTTKVDSISQMEQAAIAEKLDEDMKKLEILNEELNQTGLPIGWHGEEIRSFTFLDWLKKIGGLLLTVFAVSLGSPFWFDVLSKLANLRSSGSKPKSSLEPKTKE